MVRKTIFGSINFSYWWTLTSLGPSFLAPLSSNPLEFHPPRSPPSPHHGADLPSEPEEDPLLPPPLLPPRLLPSIGGRGIHRQRNQDRWRRRRRRRTAEEAHKGQEDPGTDGKRMSPRVECAKYKKIFHNISETRLRNPPPPNPFRA